MSKIAGIRPGDHLSVDSGDWKTVNYENVNPGNPRVINQELKRYLITDGYLMDIFSRLEGTILTIIESVTDDKEKREATKSIVRRLLWNESEYVRLLRLEKIVTSGSKE